MTVDCPNYSVSVGFLVDFLVGGAHVAGAFVDCIHNCCLFRGRGVLTERSKTSSVFFHLVNVGQIVHVEFISHVRGYLPICRCFYFRSVVQRGDVGVFQESRR